MIDQIWKPYTFFENSRIAHIHNIPSTNKFLRISSDGSILYSMRISVTTKCPMNLQSFPLDYQLCPIYISSFIYSSDEVNYKWFKKIKIPKTINKISQYYLISTYESNENWTFNQDKNYTRLIGYFKFKRSLSFYITSTYVPCLLVVLLSAIAYYIDQDYLQDRISLGATGTTILMKFHLETNNELPKLSYLKAIDYYLLICYVFIIYSLIEFAYNNAKLIQINNNKIIVKQNKKNKKKKKKKSIKRLNYYYNKRKKKIGKRLSSSTSLSTARKISIITLSSIKTENNDDENRKKLINRYTKICYPILFLLINVVYYLIYSI